MSETPDPDQELLDALRALFVAICAGIGIYWLLGRLNAGLARWERMRARRR